MFNGFFNPYFTPGFFPPGVVAGAVVADTTDHVGSGWSARNDLDRLQRDRQRREDRERRERERRRTPRKKERRDEPVPAVAAEVLPPLPEGIREAFEGTAEARAEVLRLQRERTNRALILLMLTSP